MKRRKKIITLLDFILVYTTIISFILVYLAYPDVSSLLSFILLCIASVNTSLTFTFLLNTDNFIKEGELI